MSAGNAAKRNVDRYDMMDRWKKKCGDRARGARRGFDRRAQTASCLAEAGGKRPRALGPFASRGVRRRSEAARGSALGRLGLGCLPWK